MSKDIFEIINPTNTLGVCRPLAHILGACETIVYNALLSKYRYYQKNDMLDDGWFYSTIPDLFESTSFSAFTIPDFDKLLATMRSMEISANIIIQNLAQLKKMYDKSWEILTGNCDSLLFLGGQEASTLEAISKSLGKETIDVVSQNRTRSHKSPSTSENNSILGRELMTTDELKVMKPNECVLIVRALYPFFCHKFDIEKHKNYPYLEDSNKKYAYLIDDLHTEKAPDMAEIQTETIVQKQPAVKGDDEKGISDIDIGSYNLTLDGILGLITTLTLGIGVMSSGAWAKRIVGSM